MAKSGTKLGPVSTASVFNRLSLVVKSISSVCNRLPLVFKSISLVVLSSAYLCNISQNIQC